MSITEVFFFPGMVLHEFAHVLGCLLTGIKIHEVKWFGTTEAFVKHDKPGALSGIIISLAPFVLSNALGFWFLNQAFHSTGDFVFSIVFLWLGLSALLFAFPSRQDAENTFNAVYDSFQRKIGSGPLLARLLWLITVPFVFIPLVLLLGFLLLFDYAFFLRVGWIVFIAFLAAGA